MSEQLSVFVREGRVIVSEQDWEYCPGARCWALRLARW